MLSHTWRCVIMALAGFAAVGALTACGPTNVSDTAQTTSSASSSVTTTPSTGASLITTTAAPPITTAASTTTAPLLVTLPSTPAQTPPPGHHGSDLCTRSGQEFNPPADWNSYEHFTPAGAVVFYAKYLNGRVAIQMPAHDSVSAFPHWTFRGDNGNLITDIGTDPNNDPGGRNLAQNFNAWSKLVAAGAPSCLPTS